MMGGVLLVALAIVLFCEACLSLASGAVRVSGRTSLVTIHIEPEKGI